MRAVVRFSFLFLVSALACVIAPDPTHAQKPDIGPIPTVVQIETIPPTAGVQVLLDSKIYQTDVDGKARISIANLNNLSTRLKILDSMIGDGVQAKFSRWYGDLDAGSSLWIRPIHVALDLYALINLNFVDLDGNRVDPSLITSLSLKSSIGAVYDYDTVEPRWLQGSRVVPLQGSLQSKDLYYTVQSVIIQGTNVVNTSQQRYFPSQVRDWQVQLLFYHGQFTVHDALFRFPLGSAVRLKFPGGLVRRFPLDHNAQVYIPTLPRGSYEASVEGAPGIAPSVPLALSRNQDVELKVVSYFDLGFVFVVLGTLMIGMWLFNRPRTRAQLIRLPARVFRRGAA